MGATEGGAAGYEDHAMTRIGTILAAALFWASAVGSLPGIASAQGNPFAAVATVDGMAVTEYQVAQRMRFLELLRVPGADRESVIGTLVDEMLQIRAARAAGIEVTPQALEAGLAEFAGRANLSAEQFVAELERAGVAAETFAEFVRSGLYWRGVVQQRFGARARPDERALVSALSREGGGAADVRVLLSEIALPLTPENEAAQRALAERLSTDIRSEGAFAAAAREYSAAPSAPAGGQIDWLPLGQLPPPVASALLTLGPGETTDPIALGSFIALFQLRALDESEAGPGDPATLDYAEYLIPGGRSPEALAEAGRVRARAATCDDLYEVARGQPAERLVRRSAAVDSLPSDLRQALATLDPGDASTLLSGNGVLRFVMLCGRGEAPTEEQVTALGQSILNQRLTGLAEGYLAELRADAVIVR